MNNETEIVRGLSQIHSSLVEQYFIAKKNNTILFTNHEDDITEVIFIHDSNLILAFYCSKVRKNKVEEICNKISKIIEEVTPTKYEIIINNNQALVEGLTNHGYRIIEMGSEYVLEKAKPYEGDMFYIRSYEYKCAEEYIDLIDTCFNPLRKKMGKCINYRRKNYDKTIEESEKLAKSNDFFAFYIDSLVGIGLLQKNKINTLVVSPTVQGKGYGKEMLLYLNHMILNERKYDKVLLNVVEQNERAKKFYEKCNFQLIASYRVFQ